jgi:hypothetical protein
VDATAGTSGDRPRELRGSGRNGGRSDEATVESFWEAYRGTWPVVLDPGVRAGQRSGVTSLPTILVLALDGTEVERRTGLVREPALVEAVDAALAGLRGVPPVEPGAYSPATNSRSSRLNRSGAS